MTALSFPALKDRPGRIDLFTTKFGDGDEFVFTDGTAQALSGVRIGSGRGTDYTPSQYETLKTVMEGAPRTGFTIRVLVGGQPRPISTLEKTHEFGGQVAATTNRNVSFGGKKTEVLSEVGFCFYYAMRANNHLTARSAYSPQVWRTVSNTRQLEHLCDNYNGVSGMLAYLFNDTTNINNHIQDMFLFLTQEGWDDVLRRQTTRFQSSYRLGTSYYFTRGDGMPTDVNPYTFYRLVRGAMKNKFNLGTMPVGEDKWNPADVWAFNDTGLRRLRENNRRARRLSNIQDDQYTVGLMNQMNRRLKDWYDARTIIPISLKKSGTSVSIKEINMGTSDVEQFVQYRDVLLSSSNQDVQLNFDVVTVRKGTNQRVGSPLELRMKMKTGSGGYRLEIEERRSGAAARHGSVGVGLQQFIIHGTARGGIQQLQQIRNEAEFDNIRNHFPTGGQNWMGILNYRGIDSPQILLPYVNRLMQEINSNVRDQRLTERISQLPEGPINKAGAGELAVAVDQIPNRTARDITVENLYHAAGSVGVKAGITQNQLRSRQTSLGLSEDDLVSVQGNSEVALTVFKGGPHIKIM